MMILILNTAKEQMRDMDVEPHFLVNFGILEDLGVLTIVRFNAMSLSQINLNLY